MLIVAVEVHKVVLAIEVIVVLVLEKDVVKEVRKMVTTTKKKIPVIFF